MPDNKCKYESCKEPRNLPYDKEFCIFHAEADRKGVCTDEFNERIKRRLESRRFNFRGFIFPGAINFHDPVNDIGDAFKQNADFSDTAFLGKADFRKAQFLLNADFHKSRFEGEADFSEALFKGIADFNNANFLGDANYQDAKFNDIARFLDADFGNDVVFRNVKFSRVTLIGHFENVYLNNANFSDYSRFRIQVSGSAHFTSARFEVLADFTGSKFGGNTLFNSVQFAGSCIFYKSEFLGEVSFSNTNFQGLVKFDGNTIAADIKFEEITFADDSRFYFRSPTIKSGSLMKGDNPPIIKFNKALFKPFYTYFEKIGVVPGDDLYSKTLFIFRYCELKDVYFTNNEMYLFSFYKSSFDQARFISSIWSGKDDYVFRIPFLRILRIPFLRELRIPFQRCNFLPEEEFLEIIHLRGRNEDKGLQLRLKLMLDDVSDFDEIATLYRRMKTALDYTKDYQQASWFYFNEFEMKRLSFKEHLKHSKLVRRFFSKITIYNIYKCFAGYGEKPLWSFVWLLVLVVIFALGHMVFGLKYFEGGVRHTEYNFFAFMDNFSITKLLSEFGKSLGYSLSVAIPRNYLPYKLSNMDPTNPLGIAWTVLNTVVLWILIIFIGIGLKRHFRRF